MKSHPAPTYTFKQFNDEINDLYKYLKENKFTDDEIRKIFAPLKPNTNKLKLISAILIAVLILTSLYFLTYFETISWHLSALGRIFLIKLLPYWDWTVLKNEKCLLPKSTSSILPEINFNCDLCENIKQIDVYDEIPEDVLKNRYLDVDIPVIIKKKPKGWPSSTNFIEALLTDAEIATSKPCSLSTNIYNGLTTVKNLIRRTSMFDSFFMHFQNCDFRIMKRFRSFTSRPSFLPLELSPVQYNWLLWNKNYNVSYFKSIGLVEKIALVGQIVGGNYIRLLPRNNCEMDCPRIDVRLKEGESIIFTSLWNLEYRPGQGENIAVVLEMH
ncbi:hypothetical protein BDFB_009351 [Asbolus verrucosus]|uniref:Uncharacterized protein n=1 Tax=Asbolus verrucosus TaxID=1661398 RepID=A0A482VEZ6_ASBVE|nr:hypothetical protein BDFB_009351 [Asbolus verrucosus]